MGRSTTIKKDKELEICDRHCFGFTYTTTVAVTTFHSATEEEVKREARVISNLKHPSFPLLQRIVKALSFSHIIL